MAIIDTFIAELQHESIGTRKTLERIPNDKFDWRPHPKSFSMGQLASHISDVPGWIVPILEKPVLDFIADGWKSFEGKNAADVVANFDEGLKQALVAMQGYPDEKLMEPWTLRGGEVVYFTMPRIAVMRAFVLSHLIHHRAQLGLYLRLNDVPVPSLYGPSADEGS